MFLLYMAENEEGTLSSLNSCGRRDEYIEKHSGRIFHTARDSVLAGLMVSRNNEFNIDFKTKFERNET